MLSKARYTNYCKWSIVSAFDYHRISVDIVCVAWCLVIRFLYTQKRLQLTLQGDMTSTAETTIFWKLFFSDLETCISCEFSVWKIWRCQSSTSTYVEAYLKGRIQKGCRSIGSWWRSQNLKIADHNNQNLITSSTLRTVSKDEKPDHSLGLVSGLSPSCRLSVHSLFQTGHELHAFPQSALPQVPTISSCRDSSSLVGTKRTVRVSQTAKQEVEEETVIIQMAGWLDCHATAHVTFSLYLLWHYFFWYLYTIIIGVCISRNYIVISGGMCYHLNSCLVIPQFGKYPLSSLSLTTILTLCGDWPATRHFSNTSAFTDANMLKS